MRLLSFLTSVAVAVASFAATAPTTHAVSVFSGVAVWGGGSDGQIGNASWEDVSEPAFPVESLGSVTAMSAGWGHACAIVNGSAYCWGRNDWGQLGNGTRTSTNVPSQVVGLEGKTVTDITAGGAHTCAIADGAAYCWGPEDAYRLGTGSSTATVFTTAQPVNSAGVLANKTVTDITAGFEHTCAVASGRAYCWGWAGEGRLGNGESTGGFDITAVNDTGVLNGKTVTAIQAGGSQTCAIADTRLYCWGDGSQGALGNGLFANSLMPVAVGGALASIAVTEVSVSTRQLWDASGGSHVCAIAEGKAYCWGEGSDGQLGNGQNADASIPMAVSTASDLGTGTATSIAAGGRHSCAVSGQRITCWGADDQKQLGEASASNVPRYVSADPANAVGLAAGANFTLAHLAAGSKPAAVDSLTGKGEWRAVRFTWNPSNDPGTPPATRYEVQVYEGGAWQPPQKTTERSRLFTGLAPDQTVQLRVRARNGYGTGPWATASGTANPIVLPTAVRDLTAIADAGEVTFRWQAPGNSQDAGLAGYRVQVQVDRPCDDGPDEPDCGQSLGLDANARQVTVGKLQEGQEVTVRISAEGRDGVGPESSLAGAAPSWKDTGRGEVAISASSSRSYAGVGFTLKVKSWNVYELGSRTERRYAGCGSHRVTFTPRGSSSVKTYDDICSSALMDPPKSGVYAIQYRGVAKTLPIEVVKGTNKYRLFNAKQASGSVVKGTPIVRTNMFVKRKFTDGSWLRIRKRPWIEFKPFGDGGWRRVANKASRVGWYRVANADVYWKPRKITEVRVSSFVGFYLREGTRGLTLQLQGKKIWITERVFGGTPWCFIGRQQNGTFYSGRSDDGYPGKDPTRIQVVTTTTGLVLKYLNVDPFTQKYRRSSRSELTSIFDSDPWAYHQRAKGC